MYKIKCPVCGSSHTMKNGKRKGVQLYVCGECRYQFRNRNEVSTEELWRCYLDGKQTVSELSAAYGLSPSTIKRRLSEVAMEWEQPSLDGGGFVHLDATCWGRGFGVLLALESSTGCPLYMSFVKNETTKDYEDAVCSIRARGYGIRGIIHPKLLAARELKTLVDNLTERRKAEFEQDYERWKITWRETLNRRSTLKSGRTQFTHRRLRSAMHSIDFYLPYLFTYQRHECCGMPNTNNKLEGTFTDLKKNLNNHSGMTQENRKRFISGFFLALTEALSMNKEGAPEL